MAKSHTPRREKISALLHLSRSLLETNVEPCWEIACKCIVQALSIDNAAVFPSADWSSPLAVAKAGRCTPVLADGDVPYQVEQAWGLSLKFGGRYLLHAVKKSGFSEEEQEFIHLIRNMLEIHAKVCPAPDKPAGQEVQDSPVRKDLRFPYPEIMGESPKLLQVLSTVDKIAGVDVSVLIQGESGTGKELIAAAIHHYSKRCNAPFVSENCAAIPETLLESELFGHTRGSFTGAIADKIGLLVMADKGTLFLDEVGDMSLGMQKKLLRVLQNGEIRPVGSNRNRHVDVRVITATNKDLKQAIAAGRFREDLYYRLDVVQIVAPPLRERGEDVVSLFAYFLEKKAGEIGRPVFKVPPEVRRALLSYHWPGNIRELQNEVQRILALAEGDTVSLEMLSPEISDAGRL